MRPERFRLPVTRIQVSGSLKLRLTAVLMEHSTVYASDVMQSSTVQFPKTTCMTSFLPHAHHPNIAADALIQILRRFLTTALVHGKPLFTQPARLKERRREPVPEADAQHMKHQAFLKHRIPAMPGRLSKKLTAFLQEPSVANAMHAEKHYMKAYLSMIQSTFLKTESASFVI